MGALVVASIVGADYIVLPALERNQRFRVGYNFRLKIFFTALRIISTAPGWVTLADPDMVSFPSFPRWSGLRSSLTNTDHVLFHKERRPNREVGLGLPFQ
jgi:hypothetical protein